MSEQAKWYVVHTYSGYEDNVATNLKKVVENRNFQDLITEIKVPTETVIEYVENKKTKKTETKEKKNKIFPGYVFIKMIVTDESWYAVRNIRGCTGFVGTTTDPIPLSDAEAEKLGVETVSVEGAFSIGDNVEIVDGVLKGNAGKITEVDLEQGIVKVMVSFFGRETSTELNITQVKLED